MPIDRSKLRKLVTKHFSKPEINTLCFDLHLPCEDLPSETAVELIKLVIRLGKEDVFLEYLEKKRPNVSWNDAIIVDAPEINEETQNTYTFANRHDDKLFIKSKLEREYNILLHGPSGIGKTFFARELLKEDWCQQKQTAYIDLEKLPYHLEFPKRTTDEILKKLRQDLFNRQASSLLNRSHLIKGIARNFRDMNQCGIIILDNADRIDSAILQDLRANVLPDLYKAIGDPVLYPRIIVIAQYELSALRGYDQVRFPTYALEEFKDVLVEKGVYRQLLIQAYNTWAASSLDEEDRTLDDLMSDWADQLYGLTAGHPKAIIRTLDYVGERTQYATNSIFTQLRTNVCQDVLSQLVYEQTAKNISNPNKQKAFQLLWVFRYLSDSVYEQLLHYIDEGEMEHWQDLKQIQSTWNPLNEKGLLQTNVPMSQLLTHRLSPLWRKLNNLILQVTKPILYQQFHQDARSIYEQITYDEATDDNTMRISCFGEMLYHLAQEKILDEHTFGSRQLFTQQVFSSLAKLIPYLHTRRYIDEYKRRLYNLIEHDLELGMALNQVGLDTTQRKLLDEINKI